MAVKDLNSVPMKLGLVSVLVCALLWGIASVLYRDAGHAWDVLAGIESPWSNRDGASAVGLALSVAGYLLLPILFGLTVSAGLELWIRDRRPTLSDVESEIERAVAQHFSSSNSSANSGEADG